MEVKKTSRVNVDACGECLADLSNLEERFLPRVRSGSEMSRL